MVVSDLSISKDSLNNSLNNLLKSMNRHYFVIINKSNSLIVEKRYNFVIRNNNHYK